MWKIKEGDDGVGEESSYKVKPLLTDSARMAQWLRLQDLKVVGGSIPTVVTFSLQRGSNPCIFILFKMCNGLI